MELKVGQYYLVTSSIAKGYEELLGEFIFVVRIVMLYRTAGTPKIAANGDITFSLADFSPMNGIRSDPWFAAHCLASGYDQYWQIQTKVPKEDAEWINYSPNIADGEGEWFVPDIFRYQDQFLHLVYCGIIKLLENYVPPEYSNKI